MNAPAVCRIEPLETRIAPATLFALNSANNLLRFDSATPGTIDATIPITGLGAGEVVHGIDFRPATSELFAYTVPAGVAANALGKTYVVDPVTGAATFVGQVPNTLPGLADVAGGFDFNPTVDRMRVALVNDENGRINPNNGSLAGDDTNINPNTADIIGVAYDRNHAGAANSTDTTLYAIDRASNSLVTIGGINSTPSPNGGAVTSVGALGIALSPTRDGGFDIANRTGIAFAALSLTDNLARLYTIDLATGAATLVGQIGDGTAHIFSLTVAPKFVKLVNATKATFVDEDGDLVTIKVSKGVLAADDFQIAFKSSGGGELRRIDFSDDGDEFKGANVTITAVPTKAGAGGRTPVGVLEATGVDLGKVKIPGDLEAINAGDGNDDAPALKSLKVDSLGLLNVAAQISGDRTSDIAGKLGALGVKTNVQGATVNVAGKIGPVTIGGSLVGSTTADSGAIIATGKIGAVKISGSILGGTATRSGAIDAGDKLASLTVGGSVIGGTAAGTGFIKGAKIGNVTISGSLIADTAASGTGIASNSTLGAVHVSGDLLGLGAGVPTISARGVDDPATNAAALAIESITIGGSVVNAQIRAGYDVLGAAVNPDVAIGAVRVRRDWIASDLVAGVQADATPAVAPNFFGNADDVLITDAVPDDIVSRIASVTIKGSIGGTSFTGDHFGFVAQRISAFKFGAVTLGLQGGAGNDLPPDDFLVSATGDVRVREIGV
jgi:hypothetical protein